MLSLLNVYLNFQSFAVLRLKEACRDEYFLYAFVVSVSIHEVVHVPVVKLRTRSTQGYIATANPEIVPIGVIQSIEKAGSAFPSSFCIQIYRYQHIAHINEVSRLLLRVRVGVIILTGNRQIIVELSYINITGIGIEST